MSQALATAAVSSVISSLATARASAGVEALKAKFDWSPVQTITGAWGSLNNVFGDLVGGVAGNAAAQWEQVKSIFTQSPVAMIESRGNPWPAFSRRSGMSCELRCRAAGQPAQRVRRACAVESATAAWNGVTGYFSGLWTSLTTDAQAVKSMFGDLFSQSPLESIQQKWQPVLTWFGDMWTKLQGIFGQLKELLGGNFSGVFATLTGTSAAAPARWRGTEQHVATNLQRPDPAKRRQQPHATRRRPDRALRKCAGRVAHRSTANQSTGPGAVFAHRLSLAVGRRFQ